ncbi:hypothetical protein BG011_009619 [Mortierella polycephala]|uniref:F-box domain-containing protein n=1 Tax=Mortierella polycephala TaxID=41804 RepID=A0A9P6TW40_9FUNG|nr:hypothetical protein BG011_009619 [Mortierella polycephala]
MLILELPDEIIYQFLTYAEDIDLQNLALTCKRLRGFTMDGLLRRHILLIRTPARLQSSLADRPSRDRLATQNILRGVRVQFNIQRGHYIGGAASVRSYQISCRLERQIVSNRISRKLKMRPDWTELVEKGLVPDVMFISQEDYEAKRQWLAYRQQQQLFYRNQSCTHPLDREESMDDSIDNLLPHSPTLVVPTHTSQQPNPQSSEGAEHSYLNHPRRQRKSISMALIPKIEILRKAMDRDRLSRFVQKRPSPTELNRSPKTATVLHAHHLTAFSTASSALAQKTAQLSFLLKGGRLGHWLYHRPSLAVMLNERHLLKTEARTAWMVCPGVAKKVRFYEGLIQESADYAQQQQAFWSQLHHNHHHYQYQHQASPVAA